MVLAVFVGGLMFDMQHLIALFVVFDDVFGVCLLMLWLGLVAWLLLVFFDGGLCLLFDLLDCCVNSVVL